LDWLYVGAYRDLFMGPLIDLGYIKSKLQKQNGGNNFLAYLLSDGIAFNQRVESITQAGRRGSGEERLQEYFNHHSDLELTERLSAGPLFDQIVAAAEYDSKVLQRGLELPINRPPFNSLLASVVRNVRRELPKSNYDTVLLIPHCRMSGATKIAGKFSKAVVSLARDKDILLVSTDLDINRHPEWFPDSVDTYMLAGTLEGLEESHKEIVLFDLLLGVNAKKVINFNSALGWDVYEKFGDRLATRRSLYAYFFCYDLNKNGVKVGYPSKNFVSSFSFLEKVFFDSDYLRTEVTQKNMITSDQDKHRLETLYTPVENVGVDKLFDDTARDGKKTIYWAGRLDRQKNFDLLVRIAKLLPEMDFQVWGESVIGDYEVCDYPANITINPPYLQIDELQPFQCDLWLYTSKWDGIPNLLLEIGVRGVPIVSTNVWGIGDLLNDENSWLVNDIENENSYVDLIIEALGTPAERNKRAKRLREEIIQRHSNVKYAESVSRVLYDE